MSGKVGGGNASALQGMQIQSSCYGNPIPILYGTNRLTSNLVDYDDFQATTNTTSGGGFLGLGASSIATGYTYGAMVVMGLCEGPIVTTARAWKGATVGTAANGVSGFPINILTGSRPQTAWSYLTSNHPAKALPYSGTALACCRDINLPGGSMANWSFETTGLLATEADSASLIYLGLGDGTKTQFAMLDVNGMAVTSMAAFPSWLAYVNAVQTVATGVQVSGAWQVKFSAAPANGTSIYWVGSPVLAQDAKPASVISDFLTNANYGAGVAAGWIADMVTGAASYATYCTAMKFAIAPAFKEAKAALEHLREVLDATNSEMITTPNGSGQMQIQVIPYGDVAIGSYTPVTTIQAAFTDADFLGVLDSTGAPTGSDPIEISRQSPGDTFNTVPVSFSDRMNAYNVNTVAVSEPTDAAINGIRNAGAKSLPCIVLRQHATVLSTILGQGQTWRKTTFKFCVGWDSMLLEPMDFISIQSDLMGLPTTRVRIVAITIPDEDSEDQGLQIEAEGWPSLGVAHAGPPVSSSSSGSGSTLNTNIDPGPTTTPVIFDVSPLYSVSGGPEIMVAADGGSNWGGANVLVSVDGTTYTQMGTITSGARYGVLNGAMAASGGAAVDLTLTSAAMTSTTSTLALANQSLCWVAGASGGSGGELVDFSTATLTATYKYTLTLPVRGAYGTTAATHSSGASFLVIDKAPCRIPIPLAWLATLIYIKIQPFNIWGAGIPDISTIAAVTYTPTSQGNYANPSGGSTGTIIGLNSDDILARAQKPAEINQVNQLLGVQGSNITVGSLDYQAYQLGVSHAVFDTAVTALTTWLGALSPSWSDLTQDTPLGTGGGAYLRGLWVTVATQQQVLMAAIQAAALTSASTQALIDAGVAQLQTPTAVAWANGSRPALPNGTYPAGTCVVTSDGVELQVSPDGATWKTVIVAATALLGKVIAGNLIVANYDNLIPNPNSEQAPPLGGWPAGAFEARGLTTATYYQGTGCRALAGLTGGYPQIDITPLIPCAAGDTFTFGGWGIRDTAGAGSAIVYLVFFDSTGTGVTGYNLTAGATASWSYLTTTATAPPGSCFVIARVENDSVPTGTTAYWDNLYMRRCADAQMLVDGTLQALFARIAGAISSTNYSPTVYGSGATGFRLSAVGMSITDKLGTPHTDTLLDLGGSALIGGYPAATVLDRTFNHSQEWIAPGTYSWVCPIGVTMIQAMLVAGGGSGASGRNGLGGGGGGAGGAARIWASVTPGTAYAVVVGAGGAAPALYNYGLPGGYSSIVVDSGTLAVSGGLGGTSSGTSWNGTGGAGGSSGTTTAGGGAAGGPGGTAPGASGLAGTASTNGSTWAYATAAPGAGGGGNNANGGSNDTQSGGGHATSSNYCGGGGGASPMAPGGQGTQSGTAASGTYGSGGGGGPDSTGAAGSGGNGYVKIIW